MNIKWHPSSQETNKPLEANENFITKDLILFDNKKTDEKQAGILLYGHFVVEWLREWSLWDQNEILTSGWLLYKSI